MFICIADIYNLAKVWVARSNIQSWEETKLANFTLVI
jgi:hypothetical protein